MKKGFTLFLCLFLLVYGRVCYDYLTDDDGLPTALTGSLSDIAEEVKAIPLETTGECRIDEVRQVQSYAGQLFLISDGSLFRFSGTGQYLCRINDPGQLRAVRYVIDPDRQQLIVLGNRDDVFYYTFDGDLVGKRKYPDAGNRSIISIALHQGRILTTEKVETDGVSRNCVVEYDLDFNRIADRGITTPQLSETRGLPYCFSPQLGLLSSGNLYVYASPANADHLLADSLYIRARGLHYMSPAITHYPLRFGSRFWIANNYNPADKTDNYTFCFDQENGRSWNLKEGLKDNFFKTGLIANLQAIDLTGQTYCFSKTAREARKAFPRRTADENPVVFIVRLKA